MLQRQVLGFSLLIGVAINARTVTISGCVNDTSGKGIAGAMVLLETADITTTTDADGNFLLTDANRSGMTHAIVTPPVSGQVDFTHTTPFMASPGLNDFKLQVYRIDGRKVGRTYGREGVSRSTGLVHVPPGIYLISMVSGIDRYFNTGLWLSHSLFLSETSSVKGRSENRPVRGVGNSIPTDEMLTVIKNGMLKYRSTIRSMDTAGIAIIMLPSAGEVIDADGNVYQSVRLGNQVWTVENLKTTTYYDGTRITHVPDSASWLHLYLTSSTTDAYCVYGGSAACDAKYGVFYNWYAVNTGKLAPEGWRIPTDADWDSLQTYLVAHGYNYDVTTTGNRIAKSMAAPWGWNSSTIEGAVGNCVGSNNASGFSALPGGLRHWGGSYYSLFLEKNLTYWWSSTDYTQSTAWHRYLDAHHSYLDRIIHNKHTGFPVRIVRDVR